MSPSPPQDPLRSRPASSARPRAEAPSTSRSRPLSPPCARSPASSASWAAPSSTCGRPATHPVVIDGNVEMPGRGLPRVGVRPQREGGPHRLRRRRHHRRRPRVGRQQRCRAGAVARAGPLRHPPLAAPRRAGRPHLPGRLSRGRLCGALPRHRARHALRQRRRGSRARHRRRRRGHPTGRDLDQPRPRRHPRAPCGARSVALHDRGRRSGARRRHGGQRWTHHPRRPPGLRARRARSDPPRGGRLDRGAQSPSVGGRTDARGDARRAGPPRPPVLGRRARHPAPGPLLPPLGARPVT